jgi:hypothetical protein
MDIKKMIADRDIAGLKQFCQENNLVVSTTEDGKTVLVPADDTAKTAVKARESFWDQRQQARKILLNSLYGALLNEALRFSDERMGQSVTLTGRSITRHMNAKINEIIAGTYDFAGDAICYADTDSAYFSAAPFMGDEFNNNRDLVIEIYDQVADATNDSFPAFMTETFNTGLKRGGIIAAGRELVASKALFIKKKKYACLIYDMEGTRLDENNNPGKLKAMGLDLKRADTPEAMQNFLKRILMDILQGAEEEPILKDIADFRLEFKNWTSWQKGSPKKVNGMSRYQAIKKNQNTANVWQASSREKKQMIPGHVDASLNWNRLLDLHNDKYSMRITDGSRIVVCKLKPNHLHMKSVAYPVDEPHLPQWFKELPFDDDLMEQTIIDKKIANLIAVLGWNLKATKHSTADEFIIF